MSSINQTIKQYFSDKQPFVAYRKPNEVAITFIGQKNDRLVEFTEFHQEGFVMAPFDVSEKAYVIEPDVLQKFYAFDEVQSKPKRNSFDDAKQGKQVHLKLVEDTIAFIQKSVVDKVVVARKITQEIQQLDLELVFTQMLKKYANALVYVWYHPKVGLWLGATPETLVRVKGNQFKTMALAGTQVYKDTLTPNWGEKERMEQQFVTDYIAHRLKDKVEQLQVYDTETLRAGNLLHLKTDITGTLADGQLEELVKLLHPTPAVCGLPMEESKAFILEHEPMSRSFYSGYLGELNINESSNLYVNLRCFQVQDNEVSIYVGGGITKDSLPEKEWLETVAKSEVMLSVLG